MEASLLVELLTEELPPKSLNSMAKAFADALTAIQQRHPTIEIGSYPFNRDGRLGATLVARGTDRAELTKVIDEIVADFAALGGETRLP